MVSDADDNYCENKTVAVYEVISSRSCACDLICDYFILNSGRIDFQ